MANSALRTRARAHTHTHTRATYKMLLLIWFAGAVALAAGYQHACALLDGGGISCWGYNDFGQLGTGDTIRRYTPTGVVGLSSGERVVRAFGML